jgi:small-conductance mechanosensitive channel
MRRLLTIFALAFLLLPPVFSPAQESAAGESETVPADEQPAQESVSAPETEKPDAVTSASFVMIKPKADMNQLQRLGIAIAIVAVVILLIWFIWYLFKRLNDRIENDGKKVIQPISFKKIKLLTAKQIIEIITFILRILKYVITIMLLYLTLPIVFSLFPATQNLASTLFGYILNPLRDIIVGAINYIPNLFKIIIIVFITRYVQRGIKFLANHVDSGRLVIPGFYADWAMPTMKILQVLLWAFMVAIIYPYLPGSDSRAFQGVSVFVGIIFSLGSSTAIGNLVAGLVITYMRPFKIGDRVQIKDITGFVVEKTMMVVRLKTHKNEYVTFPNTMILGSNIINYNTSLGEGEEGLIIFAEITFGYATPWQTVHDILINAALATDYVQKKPTPFVLQTMLDDFYARYQINCYTKEVSKIPAIYAMLYENIQNGFREAGIDMTAAHYRIITKEK